MVRTNQGGSILGFVIVGAVLALLLIGGAYLVQNTLSPAADRGPVAVENGDDDAEPPAEEEPGDAEEGEETPAQEQKDEQPDEQPDDEPEARDDTEEGGSGSATAPPAPPSGDEPAGTGDELQPQNDAPSNNLPETGIGSTIVTGLLISGFIGVVAVYLRSRGLSVTL